MNKHLLLAALCLATATFSKAQTAAKSVFAELGGPGLASINYDTRFTKKNGGIGGRIGVGGFSVDGEGIIAVPAAVNYLISKDNKHFFEVGAGFTYINYVGEDGYYYYNGTTTVYYEYERGNFESSFGHISLGYRLQPPKGGFQFRAAITPVFGKDFFFPFYPSVSFGYKF